MALPIRPASSNSLPTTTVALNNYSNAMNLAHIQNITTQHIHQNVNPIPPVTPIGKSMIKHI